LAKSARKVGSGAGLQSMTGFGAATHKLGELELSVEMRAVNHRHLLVKSRLGHGFASLEGDVDGLVKQRLKRGSVTLSLSATRAQVGTLASLNPEMAERYRDAIRGLGERLDMPAEVSMETLLGLPGVVSTKESEKPDDTGQKEGILSVVEAALDELIAMRQAEGNAIAKDLVGNAEALARIVARVEERMPKVVMEHQAGLQVRVAELLKAANSSQDPDVSREIALLADRLDVAEETTRLKSHLDQLDAFLAEDGPVGRKLDFLVQEIFREINTIGSKCSDAQVAHWVVEAKTLVERLREQVQNVE